MDHNRIYEKALCNIEQHHYETLSDIFNQSTRTCKYKSIQLPERMKTVRNEGSYVKVIHILKSQPNECKTIVAKKKRNWKIVNTAWNII